MRKRRTTEAILADMLKAEVQQRKADLAARGDDMSWLDDEYEDDWALQAYILQSHKDIDAD